MKTKPIVLEQVVRLGKFGVGLLTFDEVFCPHFVQTFYPFFDLKGANKSIAPILSANFD